jgi:uncharacterized membrane protein
VPGLSPSGNGGRLPAICAGVFAGTISWVLFFAGLIALAGRWRRNWWLAAADVFGGVILLAFAGIGLWRWVRRLL